MWTPTSTSLNHLDIYLMATMRNTMGTVNDLLLDFKFIKPPQL